MQVFESIEEFFRHTSPVVFVLCLVLFLLIGMVVGLACSRWIVRRRVASSRSMGRRGRERAMKILRRYGFEVLDEEVSAPGLVQIDSRLEEYTVRADALVRRKGRTYVAEFKGGPQSASITTAATRRQLLEYSCVFGTDGILLVDAHAGRIHYVRFVSASSQATQARSLLRA
jgi:hypothetical protein